MLWLYHIDQLIVNREQMERVQYRTIVDKKKQIFEEGAENTSGENGGSSILFYGLRKRGT